MLKCEACSYTYIQDWEKDDLIKDGSPLPENCGSKPFHQSDNKFVFSDADNARYGSCGYHDGSFSTYLYACPYCGTLKIQKW